MFSVTTIPIDIHLSATLAQQLIIILFPPTFMNVILFLRLTKRYFQLHLLLARNALQHEDPHNFSLEAQFLTCHLDMPVYFLFHLHLAHFI